MLIQYSRSHVPSARTAEAEPKGGARSGAPSLPVGVPAAEVAAAALVVDAAPPVAAADSFFSDDGGRLSMTGRRFPVSSFIFERKPEMQNFSKTTDCHLQFQGCICN